MSIFPINILLATDGSGEEALAARTAADIAKRLTRSCTSSMWVPLWSTLVWATADSGHPRSHPGAT